VKLIVGLGNPGYLYRNSRHNIGFSVVKALSKSHKISLKKDNYAYALTGKGRIASQSAILAAPLTFMNLSGIAVKALLEKYRIDTCDLLVVCDDLDLEFGRLKIRANGSCAGHRGMRSIMEALETENFCRLRLGIGRPLAAQDVAKFVLTPFLAREKRQLKEITARASECCVAWLVEGVSCAMNVFNKKL
jgi:PTH1 family peptidyl-tRNA hydrolase